MNFLMNMPIGRRLAAEFAFLVALLTIITVTGVTRIGGLDEKMDVIVHDRLVKVQLANTIENEVNRRARAVRTALMASDDNIVRAELAKIDEAAPLVAKAIEQLEATIHTPQGKAALLADGMVAFAVESSEMARNAYILMMPRWSSKAPPLPRA